MSQQFFFSTILASPSAGLALSDWTAELSCAGQVTGSPREAEGNGGGTELIARAGEEGR